MLARYPDMAKESWDLETAERRIEEFAATHGIPLIQPYQTFRAAKGLLFFGGDGHMTPEGHNLMAEVLATALKSRNLFPDRRAGAHQP